MYESRSFYRHETFYISRPYQLICAYLVAFLKVNIDYVRLLDARGSQINASTIRNVVTHLSNEMLVIGEH